MEAEIYKSLFYYVHHWHSHLFRYLSLGIQSFGFISSNILNPYFLFIGLIWVYGMISLIIVLVISIVIDYQLNICIGIFITTHLFNFAFSVEITIRHLYSQQRSKARPPPAKMWCPGYEIKLHPIPELFGVWSTPSLPLLPGSHCPGELVLVGILFTFFGLLSSSLSPCLSQRFGRCTLRPSSAGWNVELSPLFRFFGIVRKM